MASKTNRVEVPAAKAAMDRFKTEVASELRVTTATLLLRKQEASAAKWFVV